MTEAFFTQRNSDLWKTLEQNLQQPANGFYEIDNRMQLYRIVSGHLSYARAHYPGSSLCNYLEDLTAKAHGAIYAHTAKSRAKGFLRHELPTSVNRNLKLIFLSAAIFLGAALLSFVISMVRPDYRDAFLPDGYKGMTEQQVRMEQSSLEGATAYAATSSSTIMVNNIRVTVLAFGLGLTCGIGTVYILIFNGFMLGALCSLYARSGALIFFWSLILPHGVWELTAIFISGGAGLCLGYSLLRPGPYRRVDALLSAARNVLPLIVLVTFMLVVAGIIEGFLTPSMLSPAFKLTFSALTGVPIVLYILYARKRFTVAAPSPANTAAQSG